MHYAWRSSCKWRGTQLFCCSFIATDSEDKSPTALIYPHVDKSFLFGRGFSGVGG